ncbi:hypothetical protein PR202_gb14202 [Eleusine coracana subsp. coracana]|uniref:Uncharacterized protein n=1 Tax=Eleusine coracana subsp. coracana TaxID=191504 RepID=A0AAV5EW29_ELECO|nr:hypothetical protein PR202_gb14202 [Eleusine coracana subsp. coracana]
MRELLDAAVRERVELSSAGEVVIVKVALLSSTVARRPYRGCPLPPRSLSALRLPHFASRARLPRVVERMPQRREREASPAPPLLRQRPAVPPFDAVVHSLKSSLAATLATHAPLVGRLVHLADTGDVATSCSASDGGVKFVVAESDADARRLAFDDEHDVQTFDWLVPEVDMTVLTAPVLAVQATRLEGGGVVVGVSDGRSLWRFIEAWAAACRGVTPPVPPTFDR